MSNFSEDKKAKGVNKNVVATICHSGYKDTLLNKKCLRHSVNRIQSKNYRLWNYTTKKIYLSCFHNKTSIVENGIDALALGH